MWDELTPDSREVGVWNAFTQAHGECLKQLQPLGGPGSTANEDRKQAEMLKMADFDAGELKRLSEQECKDFSEAKWKADNKGKLNDEGHIDLGRGAYSSWHTDSAHMKHTVCEARITEELR